ncbi:MAG: hypothetical protein MJY91_03930 [Bacteroidales bacterium]|nr:hypothetical protein [Candidatus Cryptobacteroides choladohippi]MCQ2179236.1 hypothetical protein [Bacteroidales bacterium]
MDIDYENDEIKDLVNHKYTGEYKKYRSNAKLIRNLDKVIKYLESAEDIIAVGKIASLHYEPLTGSPYSAVRVGFDTKYRLIFNEKEDKLTLLLIELNEHYGDH